MDGGVERHVYELSAELVRRGHSVDVFTSDETRGAGKLPHYEEKGGIRVHRFKSLASLGEFGRVWPGFTAEIVEDDFDVVHAHAFRHPHSDMSLVVSKIKGIRCVMTAHSPFHPRGTRRGLAEALVQAYDTMIAPLSLRGFDSIVSLTPVEVDRLVALGAPRERVVVISHGVGPENFLRTEAHGFLDRFGLDDGKYALYLGRIHPTKGLDVLLNAFARTPAREKMRLVIAGPATSKEEKEFSMELRQLADRLKIADRVVLTGRLTEEEKLEAYECCRCFVLPSSYEPYGIVLLEAAAHRKPILSTLTDGPRNIVSDGVSGLLVKPNSPADLARALETLLTDDSLVERMSTAAFEMAESHSWEKVAAQVEATYSGNRGAG